jgi:hypothetical protein
VKRLLALMAMLLAYPGNADTIIDGSSQETFQKSINRDDRKLRKFRDETSL